MSDHKIRRFMDLFDLKSNFSEEELKIAYRDLVQVWHPDMFSNNERLKVRAETQIRLINEAYSTLGNLLKGSSAQIVRDRNKPDKDGNFPKKNNFFRSIFHATDFTELSDTAFAHALRISLSSKARLDLFHVAPDHRRDVVSEFPKIRDTLARWDVISESNAEEDMRNLGFSYTKVVAVHKDPVASILHYLKTNPYDITVLAAHQRSGAIKLLHKSVAEKVSRESGGLDAFSQKQ